MGCVASTAFHVDIPGLHDERLLFGQIVQQRIGRRRVAARQQVDRAHPLLERDTRAFKMK